MSIHAALHHQTVYRYDRRVSLSPQLIRLRPAPHARTEILGYSLKVLPDPHFLNWQQDPFGNWMARIVFPEKIDHLEINVGVVADLMVINPFGAVIPQNKRSMAFMWEQIHRFSPRAQEVIARYIPVSRRLEAMPREAGRITSFSMPSTRYRTLTSRS